MTLTGDPVPPEDATLIIMNHRTRFDWLFVFSYIIRCGPLRRFKISLKEVLKNVPGPGKWLMVVKNVPGPGKWLMVVKNVPGPGKWLMVLKNVPGPGKCV